MKGIIDRRENGWVIIEIEGEARDVAEEEVDETAVPGDVVIYQERRWVKDQFQTGRRAEKIRSLMDDVWEEEV